MRFNFILLSCLLIALSGCMALGQTAEWRNVNYSMMLPQE